MGGRESGECDKLWGSRSDIVNEACGTPSFMGHLLHRLCVRMSIKLPHIAPYKQNPPPTPTKCFVRSTAQAQVAHANMESSNFLSS